nr:M23 family metallopeptidase [Candidatus Woesearchaeota archaeon]
MRCKNNYSLPINFKKIIHWHKRSSPAHIDKFKNSIDFFAPEGTLIYSSLDGICVWLKNDFRKAGGKKYINQGNRIVIKHKNGEYTAYEHNKYKSAKIKIGAKIKKGQVIAEIGDTGWTNKESHLHFEVFSNPDREESEGETLQISFGISRKRKCNKNCYN